MTRTAAVTVVWRRLEDTLDAIQSLAAMTPAPDAVICVAQELDTSDLHALDEAMPPGGEIIPLAVNVGFSGAANAGMERARQLGAEHVLLLNNDATVATQCLARCLAEMHSDPSIAVVGPAIAFKDRPTRLWYGGGRQSHLFAFTQHRGLNRASARPPRSGDTEYVPGCCALYSMSAWREVGPFREDFFMYYEDADWGARARRAGWRLRYVGEVLCEHAVGVSSQQRGSLGLGDNTAYYLGRNPLRFALDTPEPWLRISRVLGLMTIWNAYNAWRIVQSRRLSVAQSYARGLRDAVAGRMGQRPGAVALRMGGPG